MIAFDPLAEALLDHLHVEPNLAPRYFLQAVNVNHPVAGRFEVSCDVSLVPEDDQQVVLLTAQPGSDERGRRAAVSSPGRRGDAAVVDQPVDSDQLVLANPLANRPDEASAPEGPNR